MFGTNFASIFTFVLTSLIAIFNCDFTIAKLSEKNGKINAEDFLQSDNSFGGFHRSRRNANPTPLPVTNYSSVYNLNPVAYCDALAEPQFQLGQGSLLTYLLRSQLCKLTANRGWFDQQCSQNVYALTTYYQKVYLKFCDPSIYARVCSNGTNPSKILNQWMNKYSVSVNSNVTETHYKSSIDIADFDQQDDGVRELQCQSIESYFDSFRLQESNVTKNEISELKNPFYNVSYSEWFLTFRAFCNPYACGVSKDNYRNLSLSAYECAPEYCKKNIILAIIIDASLALIIALANIIVLLVAAKSSVMRNIPGYFKISLALADFLVGVVVIPGCVYNQFVLNTYPLPYRVEGQMPLSTDYFSQNYLNFMGMFTVWSFAISIYTMGAASIDRYLAITKPFKYKQEKCLTKMRTIVVLAAIWVFGFFLGLYPVFGNFSPYAITGLNLVLSTGPIAIVVHSVTLGLPLLAVWVINLALLTQVCSDRKNRRALSVSRKKLSRNSQSQDFKARNKNNVCSSTSRLSNQSNEIVFDEDCDAAFNNNSNVPRGKNHTIHKRTSEASRNSFDLRFQRHWSVISSSVQTTFKKRFRKFSSSSQSHQSLERKLAKTLSVMIGAFTLAILPCIIILSLIPALELLISPQSHPRTYSAVATNVILSLEFIFSRLFLSNSFWNCIIYSVRNKKFRTAMIDIFVFSEDRRRRRRSRLESTVSISRNRNSENLKRNTYSCSST